MSTYDTSQNSRRSAVGDTVIWFTGSITTTREGKANMTSEERRQTEIDAVFTTMHLESPQARASFAAMGFERPAAQFNVVIANTSNPF
ncbi:hypothetical protein BHE97_18545 [Aeromicrobium sp. PE09-221]|uniref:hypothetical protein n=1 Tax=Aeromicrobium sp. PE09-221 TaxID=1898043 RepID=UPI000B3E6640|nr:hypothetical protein [Aeromicrobium sp. PE09-221]OUZ06744.1 hypothetical protein BHE97_18545 [Aeromicrobium sp. PE09-221]